MSKNKNNSHMVPSAPPSFEEFGNHRGPPPPSYDECMKMNEASPTTAPIHQYTNYNPTCYQQQQAFQPLPPQMVAHTINYATVGPSTSYGGYVNPYQTHIQQQQGYLNSAPLLPHQSTYSKSTENVLYLAKGASIRTTSTGAVTIPPPPPGCTPTPGQLAAMCGQPVTIKKQKKSFF